MVDRQNISDLRVCVVGLGSMGKRRVRNFTALGAKEIWGFDLQTARREEAHQKYGIETFAEFEAAAAKKPDVFIISTPPDWHTPYALEAAKRQTPFFTEASVVSKGMQELIDLCKKENTWGVPSCTMRFYPGPKKIKEILNSGQIGKPVSFTYHCGQYLPDWHPWEDYRKFYAGKRETGAAREITPFEMVWLLPLFGKLQAVQCMKGKTGSLDVDIDDVYQMLFRYQENVFGHVQIDALAREAVRDLRILGTEGTLEWRMMTHEVRVFSASTKKWTAFPLQSGTAEAQYVNPEEPYIAEMKAVAEAVLGKQPFPYTLEEDLAFLHLLEAAEKSSDSGREMPVQSAELLLDRGLAPV